LNGKPKHLLRQQAAKSGTVKKPADIKQDVVAKSMKAQSSTKAPTGSATVKKGVVNSNCSSSFAGL